jgi:hypothetical protein
MTNATNRSTTVSLGGWRGDSNYFIFREYSRFDPEQVVDVLHGRVAGMIFRGMVDPRTCADLCQRFWESPALKERPSEELNYYLGAYHYHKTTDQYLDESTAVADELAAVLDVPDNPLEVFGTGLAEALSPNAVVRQARHNGREACAGLLRTWRGRGEFALKPHEDLSQCAEPKQADFEIQRVRQRTVCALNICLENGAGGRLRYWNVQPDESSKHELGLHYSGWPYPVELLAGYESIALDVGPGDVYVFNGAHVHAVEPNTEPNSRRTTLSGLFGFVDDRTVVFWT